MQITVGLCRRQFWGQMDKPGQDYIEGLSPAISIDQRLQVRNPRSTVGTVTGDLRLLSVYYLPVLGMQHCPECRVNHYATNDSTNDG